MRKRIIPALFLTMLVCIIAALCAACGSKAELKLDKTSVQLYVNGQTATIRASIEPADKSAKYEWTVEDEDIATISAAQASCRITPVSEGKTTVTVKVGDLSATCEVNVGADQHVQLAAPSFTYDAATGVITITDTKNDAANVGGYKLYFLDGEGNSVGDVEVASGDAIDTRRMEKGTYTIKLTALGASSLYLESEMSDSSATVEVTVDPMYDLGVGDAGAQVSADRWSYYTYDWVTAHEAYFYDGVVTFTFSNNAGTKDYTWITQLIYNYGAGEDGKTYTMTLNINSTASGRISLNGKAVTLQEGDNRIAVGFEGTNLFKIQFGVSGEETTLKEGTVKVSIVEPVTELTERTPLAVPSFTYDAESNTVAITDNENSPYDVTYKIGFFTNPDDASPKGSAVVVDGGEVDKSLVSSGTYYLRIMAATTGLPYTDSAWSVCDGTTIDVLNERVDIKNGGESVAATNPDTWYEWHDATGNGGSGVKTTIEYAYVDLAGDIHLSYTVGNGDGAVLTHQPIKLLYMYSSMNEGDVYKLSFKIVCPAAGKITVNNTIFTVTEGENLIEVTRIQPNKSNGTAKNTITIQLGAQETVTDGEGNQTTVKTMLEGEFLITDITVEKLDVTVLDAPEFTYDGDSATITITDGNEAGVGSYEIGLFADGETQPAYVLTVVDGGTLDFSALEVADGTYTLKIRAIADSVLYMNSDWAAPEVKVTATAEGGQVTVVADTKIDIGYGMQAAAASDPGVWYEWHDKDGNSGSNVKTTIEYAYVTLDNQVYLSYVVGNGDGSKVTSQPIKLFCMYDEIAEGQEYTLSFKLVSSVEGKITVNGKVVDIIAGENLISVTRTQPNKSNGTDRNTINIQFGAKVNVDGTNVNMMVEGEFVLSDITVTPTEAE